ncbi:MAG: hypothetical protein HLX50_12785 [Alteromonadaceae bacterium]|nr:hypothetical protein [Alteromonadaceae bacterium]
MNAVIGVGAEVLREKRRADADPFTERGNRDFLGVMFIEIIQRLSNHLGRLLQTGPIGGGRVRNQGQRDQQLVE